MGSKVRSADSDASLLPKEVGARLRQLRLEAGLTQSDVALRMCRPGDSFRAVTMFLFPIPNTRTHTGRPGSQDRIRVFLFPSKPVSDCRGKTVKGERYVP